MRQLTLILALITLTAIAQRDTPHTNSQPSCTTYTCCLHDPNGCNIYGQMMKAPTSGPLELVVLAGGR